MPPRPRILLLAAALYGIVAAPAGAQGDPAVITVGDSITAGSDDEPLPADSCSFPVQSAYGWRGLLSCELSGYDWHDESNGGWSSYAGLTTFAAALDAFPQGDTALLSFHVNDCRAESCGRVCSGGSEDGLPCVGDGQCPGGLCDTAGEHACTSAETRANLKTIVDELLVRGYGKVVFWKSPGRIRWLELGTDCAQEQFDGSADAVDTMFLTEVQPTGYADEPRVVYLDSTFRDFCVGTGLQGCDPDDGLGDRRAWWFARDSMESGAHVHPNAWGYMELAARLGEELTGAALNTRPPTPSVTLLDVRYDAIDLSVSAGPDPDGDPVTTYAWVVPSNRECGSIEAADLDGNGERDLVVVNGTGTIPDLTPQVQYRICAVAYDGFQGSYFSDAVEATTPPPDFDGDGVYDWFEQWAPNGGDGNGDGTPDYIQADVASLQGAGGSGYLTLEVSGGCDRVTEVQALEASAIPTADPGWTYPFGMVSFHLECDAAEIELRMHGGSWLPGPFRRHGPTTPGVPSTAAWYQPPGVERVIEPFGGALAATVRFSLSDGSFGDDTAVDGDIVGVGGAAASVVGAPALGPVAQGLLALLLGAAACLRLRRAVPSARRI